MRRNCINASWEKGRIPDVMAGAERKMPEKKREADRWVSRTTATGACERPASSRRRQPSSRMRSLTARAPAAQFPRSPSDTRVPPRSTSSAEASRSLARSARETETNRDQTKAIRNKCGTGSRYLLQYVINPARRLTTYNRLMHGWGSPQHSKRARPSWMICALRSPRGRRRARVRRCRTDRLTPSAASPCARGETAPQTCDRFVAWPPRGRPRCCRLAIGHPERRP